MHHPVPEVPEDLTRLLGDPADAIVLADGATAWIWDLDPTGTGIAVARSASREAESISTQAHQLLAFAKQGHPIRRVIVSVGSNGNRRFHERPDLLAVEAAVAEQPRWCEFVAFTDLYRVSRSPIGFQLFREWLDEHGVRLVLSDAGPVAEDNMALRSLILSTVAELKRVETAAVGERIRRGRQARRHSP